MERREGLVAGPSRRLAVWLTIAVLAWVQFPFGSNRPWSWSLFVALVALIWLVWIPSGVGNLAETLRAARRVAVPGVLLLGVLLWIGLQGARFTPANWHNPLWIRAAHGLGHGLEGAISINPYETSTELMKLASYVAFGWLVSVLAARYEDARLLFVALFAIGVAYALYGITLSALNTSQLTLFEGLEKPYGRDVSGGFVAKNSFATFTGMALLAGAVLLVEAGRHRVVASRGWRTHWRTLIQFALGHGAGWLTGSLVLLGALIASDSRAGLMATLFGLLAIFVLTLIISARKNALRWAVAGGAGAFAAIALLFVVSGENVQSRFASLIETAGAEEMRPIMWNAALRAIADHPWMGTGLGTYRDAYYLYTDRFVPYVVDRAHNDYLEFALGAGIPAAAIWIAAIAMLAGICARGALRRHRRQIYALGAVGATVLVGFHSLFDFSLQMPAVSAFYAAMLGIGIGQSQSSRAAAF
jgi:O-antigen ligase